MGNPVRELYDLQGQSPWLDYIRRDMLLDGGLKRYIDDDGIRGVTANPTIFEKAIAAGTDYDEQITQLLRDGVAADDLFEPLAARDITLAADLLRPVYEASGGSDGFVSIEVSPEKAFQTQETIDEAKRWWALIGRPNLMVKIPATEEGLPAIEECIAAGLNINVTLIFSLEFYKRVMEAYIRGLERRVEAAGDISASNSVASFFVSRVDTATDKLLEAKIAAAEAADSDKLRGLLGKIANANAKLAYGLFKEAFGTARFAGLKAHGARPQRPLWASTGTKNPAYSDTLYVSELIGPDTVNTMPPQTIDAFRDHGVVARTIDADHDAAVRAMADLAEAGISIDEVTSQLQAEGVEAFAKSFSGINATIEKKVAEIKQRASAA